MREAGFHGPARLSPVQIDAACRLFGWQLRPHEVEALLALDLVTLYPDPPTATDPADPPAWPVKKD